MQNAALFLRLKMRCEASNFEQTEGRPLPYRFCKTWPPNSPKLLVPLAGIW